jgi:hypothetical protein
MLSLCTILSPIVHAQTRAFKLDTHNLHKYMQFKHEILCRSGQYVHDRGHVRCTECEPGYWCTDSKKHICPQGKYNDVHRGTYCKSCDAARQGATECKPRIEPKEMINPNNTTGAPTKLPTLFPTTNATLPVAKKVQAVTLAHSLAPPFIGALSKDPLLQGIAVCLLVCLALMIPHLKRCCRRRCRKRRRGRARRA